MLQVLNQRRHGGLSHAQVIRRMCEGVRRHHQVKRFEGAVLDINSHCLIIMEKYRIVAINPFLQDSHVQAQRGRKQDGCSSGQTFFNGIGMASR